MAEVWVGEAHSFSSKDEGSGRPDTGLVMMQCDEMDLVAFRSGRGRLDSKTLSWHVLCCVRKVVVVGEHEAGKELRMY